MARPYLGKAMGQGGRGKERHVKKELDTVRFVHWTWQKELSRRTPKAPHVAFMSVFEL